MRNSLVLILLLTASCAVLEPEEKFLPPEGDASVVNGSRYISHTSEKIVNEVGLVVLNAVYRGFDNDYLAIGDITPAGQDTYTIESFEVVTENAVLPPLSVVFLIDQSGDYGEVDRYNTRAQVFNKFMTDLTAPDRFIAAGFSRSGRLDSEPVEFFGADFSNASDAHRQYVVELAGRTGGSAPVFEAVNAAVDKLLATAGASRKEIILTVHANDDGQGAISADQLIAKAAANDVRVHVVVLGDVPDHRIFSRIALETGGLYSSCPSMKELSKVFRELYRLLSRQYAFYRLRVAITPASANAIQPGAVFDYRIEIEDAYTADNFPSAYITVKIPQ